MFISTESQCILHCEIGRAANSLVSHCAAYGVPANHIQLETLVQVENLYTVLEIQMSGPSRQPVCVQCQSYPLIHVAFTADLGEQCILYVCKNVCQCIHTGIARFVDRFWRSYIGGLYSGQLITHQSGVCAVSICDSDESGWRAILTRDLIILVEAMKSRAERCNPISSALLAGDMSDRYIYNRSTGELLHDDTVRRKRARARDLLARAGFFDVIVAMGE
jgi:hypothetical protein